MTLDTTLFPDYSPARVQNIVNVKCIANESFVDRGRDNLIILQRFLL